MQIQLNGQPYSPGDVKTIADLLDALAMTGRRVAVELNTEIVPRSQYAETLLKDGDRLEIVQAIGGG